MCVFSNTHLMWQLLCDWKQNNYSKCHTFHSSHINLITTELTYCTEHVKLGFAHCSLSHHFTYYWSLEMSVPCLQTRNWHVHPLNVNWWQCVYEEFCGCGGLDLLYKHRERQSTQNYEASYWFLLTVFSFLFSFSHNMWVCVCTHKHRRHYVDLH